MKKIALASARGIRLTWNNKTHDFGGLYHAQILRDLTYWIMGQENCSRPAHMILTQIRKEKLVEFGWFVERKWVPYNKQEQDIAYKEYF
jgi:hypothetical protein